MEDEAKQALTLAEPFDERMRRVFGGWRHEFDALLTTAIDRHATSCLSLGRPR